MNKYSLDKECRRVIRRTEEVFECGNVAVTTYLTACSHVNKKVELVTGCGFALEMKNTSGKHQKVFTKEEELLLQDFSRNVSTKSSALFCGNAFIVSAIPIWLFWRIHMIDLLSSLIFFIIVTLASTYLVALAYKNTKFVLKHKIAGKREEAVTREMSKKLLEDKKMSKKEKDERILWKKNEVADYEATTFSIFYNNALFLALVIFSSFYLLKSFSPSINYVLSVSSAGGLLALLSTSSQ